MEMTKEMIQHVRDLHRGFQGVQSKDDAQVQAICDLALSALDRKWRPLSEAPRDGTQILGRVDYTDQMWTVVYLGGFHPNSPGKHVWRDAFSKRPVQEFEAWMPLPEPPKEKP